jgi:hypothetical protein
MMLSNQYIEEAGTVVAMKMKGWKSVVQKRTSFYHVLMH